MAAVRSPGLPAASLASLGAARLFAGIGLDTISRREIATLACLTR
jgi:hypothetical protein